MMRTPYLSTDPDERRRQEHTALRHRILAGDWEHDLRARYVSIMGRDRAYAAGVQIRGVPDQSTNFLRSFAAEASTLYDRGLTWDSPDQDAAERLGELLQAAGYPEIGQRVQRDTIAARDHVLRVSWDGEALSLDPIGAHLVEARALRSRPSVPVQIRHSIPAHDGEDWVYLEQGIADVPYYRAVDARGRDVSPAYLRDEEGRDAPPGGFGGDAYPYRDQEGRPILSYVLYHAARTGRLWDPYEGSELVDGTLNLGVLWSFWQHVMRNASWPQRWAINAEPVGQGADVEADPAVLLIMEATERVLQNTQGSPTVQVGQWNPGGDPKSMAEAISIYERRLIAISGLPAAEAHRVSGDPRSGYALGISRDAKREAQRAYRPIFAAADRILARTAAVLYNRGIGAPVLPESGYEPVYAGIPLSPEELRGVREDVIALLDRRLITIEDAIARLYPEATARQRRQLVERLREERAGSTGA